MSFTCMPNFITICQRKVWELLTIARNLNFEINKLLTKTSLLFTMQNLVFEFTITQLKNNFFQELLWNAQ